MSRRIVVLTDGHSHPLTAKTAISLIRYSPTEVVAVLDGQTDVRTSGELLGVGGDLPVVGRLADAPAADCLVIGIAPPGGKIPAPWRAIVLEAIRRGMDVVSGLHDLLREDPELVTAAREQGTRLVDLRDNDEHDVTSRQGLREDCLRIHTIANDCSCGKMVAAIEVARGLAAAGVDAKFVATGQTGIVIEGDGCPIDRVIADFVGGAAEKLVLTNQAHDVLVIEGQGSLFHPRYSCVTLGLLHGTMPDGMILCYEMGRETVYGMPQFRLPALDEVVRYYETTARIMHPSRVIGVSVNGRTYSDPEVDAECARVEAELGLPACDVFRHGPKKLIDAVVALRTELGK